MVGSWLWEVKHGLVNMRVFEVFLSHSGRQKDFVEQLYVDLTREEIKVFFDKESLFEGEEYPQELTQAASTCKVVAAVLSEDFFTASSWPMAEIIASVQAKTPTLIPLFYSISPETTRDATKLAEWCSKWESWNMERHSMDVEHWKKALKVIGTTPGVVKGHLSEVEYRSQIVSRIKRILSRTEPELVSEKAPVMSCRRSFAHQVGVLALGLGLPIGLGMGIGIRIGIGLGLGLGLAIAFIGVEDRKPYDQRLNPVNDTNFTSSREFENQHYEEFPKTIRVSVPGMNSDDARRLKCYLAPQAGVREVHCDVGRSEVRVTGRAGVVQPCRLLEVVRRVKRRATIISIS